MSEIEFRDKVLPLQSKFKTMAEGEILFRRLYDLGITFDEKSISTTSTLENGELRTYLNPTKIIDDLVARKIQIKDGKVINNFDYGNLMFLEEEKNKKRTSF